MTSPHTAGRAESLILQQQKAHYAAVKARLNGNRTSQAVGMSRLRLAVLIGREQEPLPHVRPKRVRDVIYLTAPDHAPSLLPVSKRKVIVREVCEKYGVSWLDITSDRRSTSIVAARGEAYYRLRHETPMSFPQIGQMLGGKDHSTVIHGIRRYEAKLAGKVYKPSWQGRSNKAFAEAMEDARE